MLRAILDFFTKSARKTCTTHGTALHVDIDGHKYCPKCDRAASVFE